MNLAACKATQATIESLQKALDLPESAEADADEEQRTSSKPLRCERARKRGSKTTKKARLNGYAQVGQAWHLLAG